MKRCVICNKEIDTLKEKWVKLIDYNGEEKVGEVHYHLQCWKDKDAEFDKRCREKVQQSISMLPKLIPQIMNQINPQDKKEEVYEIK